MFNFLKNNFIKIFVFTVLALIILFSALMVIDLTLKKYDKKKFYYVDYKGKISYEMTNVPKQYSEKEFMFLYLAGPYNKKKFPTYFLKDKYIDKIEFSNNMLYIFFNKEGYLVFQEMEEPYLDLIAEGIQKTLSNENITINQIIFIYSENNMEIKKILLKN